MKIGILALQGDVVEHVRAFEALGESVVQVRSVPDLAGLDALVLPGGESTTISVLLDSSGLFHAISGLLADGLPAFGTCAGMILLSRATIGGRADQRCLGAIDIVVRRNAFGRQVESFERDLRIEGRSPDWFRGVFIRAPVVEDVGDGVVVLAEVEMPLARGRGERTGAVGSGGVIDRQACKPVLCRQGSVMAAAFHPELAGDLRLHEMFLSVVSQQRPPTASNSPCSSGISRGSNVSRQRDRQDLPSSGASAPGLSGFPEARYSERQG